MTHGPNCRPPRPHSPIESRSPPSNARRRSRHRHQREEKHEDAGRDDVEMFEHLSAPAPSVRDIDAERRSRDEQELKPIEERDAENRRVDAIVDRRPERDHARHTQPKVFQRRPLRPNGRFRPLFHVDNEIQLPGRGAEREAAHSERCRNNRHRHSSGAPDSLNLVGENY